MYSAHPQRFIGLLLGCVTATACSHQQNAGGESKLEAIAPATAIPHSVLTEEDIQRVPDQPIEQLLASRFTGVLTSRTSGGGLSVRIRGVGSFFSSNEPLYVIDDVPINLGDGATLRAINPRDIASIEVIKDPAGLALYGVRGANGVIVIRTKRR
ncbi:MAG TPA: TonB-dependent receptor plug domain-containing protein [Gemmatimonadales bacterium]|jgi:TonB-dependent SusC/RagA subfamily outer membrane receptor